MENINQFIRFLFDLRRYFRTYALLASALQHLPARHFRLAKYFLDASSLVFDDENLGQMHRAIPQSISGDFVDEQRTRSKRT